MTAKEIIARLIVEIPEQFPARVRRRNVGTDNREGRFIRYGTPGEADITGILAPGGVVIEIEVKAGKDQPSEVQKSFLKMIRHHGGIALIARDVDQTLIDLRAEIERRQVANQ